MYDKYPCGCKIEWNENSGNAENIHYCKKHSKLKNSNLSKNENALNLEDAIYDDYEDEDIE